jgi:outer membrane protein W
MLLATSTAAWAQSPKVEVGALFGYSLTDGVSGDPYKAADGAVYDRVDPKDSMAFGLSFGYFVTPKAQIGFMWRRQPTSIEVSGTTVKVLGDMNIDGYHGYFAYYFGDEESNVRPYILGGLGATNYGAFSFKSATGTQQTTAGNAQFSSTWGAGVKIYPSPHVGLQAGMQWTPTYIKSDAAGWWCGWYGCYVVSNAQYSNQFEFVGGITFRF